MIRWISVEKEAKRKTEDMFTYRREFEQQSEALYRFSQFVKDTEEKVVRKYLPTNDETNKQKRHLKYEAM